MSKQWTAIDPQKVKAILSAKKCLANVFWDVRELFLMIVLKRVKLSMVSAMYVYWIVWTKKETTTTFGEKKSCFNITMQLLKFTIYFTNFESKATKKLLVLWMDILRTFSIYITKNMNLSFPFSVPFILVSKRDILSILSPLFKPLAGVGSNPKSLRGFILNWKYLNKNSFI